MMLPSLQVLYFQIVLIHIYYNLIIIDNYIIEGNNLRIKEINEYNIIILGCFKIISLSDEK